MPKYFLSYDLNGSTPTHAQMDKHIQSVATEYARVLETVWYIRSYLTVEQLYKRLDTILSANDRILVIEAKDAWFRNLLIANKSLQDSWVKAA